MNPQTKHGAGVTNARDTACKNGKNSWVVTSVMVVIKTIMDVTSKYVTSVMLLIQTITDVTKIYRICHVRNGFEQKHYGRDTF